jgi:CshA-type fibril repeat protein
MGLEARPAQTHATARRGRIGRRGRPHRGVTAVTVLALALAGIGIDLSLADPAAAASPGNAANPADQAAACAVPFPVFVNPSFETPTVFGSTDVAAANSPTPTTGVGWSTNDPTDNLELWQSGYRGTPSDTGNQFDELNANGADAIWQDIPTTPGTVIDFSFAHRGRVGTDVMEFEAGAQTGAFVQSSAFTVLKTASDGTTAWGHYTGSYTVPAGQTTTRFAFNVVSETGGDTSVGNFIDSLTIGIESNACADTATALQGTTTTIPVLANDGGTGLVASLPSATSAQGGTLSVGATGAVSYTPKAGFAGTDTFSYVATDAGGNTSTATVTVTVPPVPTAPNLTSTGPTPAAQTATVTIPTGGSVTLLDSSGNPAASVPVPGEGTYTLSGSTITFTPVSGYTGTSTAVRYRVADSYAQTATGTYTPTVTPAASNDARSTPDGTPLTASVPAAIGTAPYSYAEVTGPTHGTLTLASNGAYTYTPAVPFSGTDSFTYTASDSSGTTSAPKTVTITVTPVAVPDAITTPYGTSHAGTAASLVGNDDGTGLTLTGVGSAGSGTVALSAGGYTYTPAAGFSGTTAFTYTATDSSGAPETGTVTVTVLPAPPVATADTGQTTTGVALTDGTNLLSNDTGAGPLTAADATAPSHGTVTVNPNGTYDYTPAAGFSGTDTFTYTATDADGQASAPGTVTITVLPQAAADSQATTENAPLTTSVPVATGTGPFTYAAASSPTHGTLTLNASGSYTYTPTAGYLGTDSFTYTATDAAGGVSAPVTVTITVVKPTAPKAVADAGTTPAGQALTSGTNLLANDSGTGTLTAADATAPGHGSVTVNADGSYDYVPTAGFSGTDTFTYTASDGFGQVSAPATVTITVTPAAASDSYVATGGTTLTVPVASGVLANDSGTDLTVTSHTDPGHGTLTQNADGSLSYTPTVGFTGNDTYTYVATDAAGQASPAATVTITVGPPTVPVAHDDTATTPAGATLTSGADVLDNDAGGGPLTAALVAGPADGSVTLNADGTYSYTPAAGFSGTDTFTYRDNDSYAQHSAPATVTITVTPSTQPDNATVTGGSPYQGTSVLANDDGTGLTAVNASAPAHGTVTLNADGTYSYTPTLGYAGTDTFTYQAKDSAGQLSPATTVTLDVVKPAKPVAKPDTLTTTAGASDASDSNLLDNDTGTVPLTASLAAAPLHGTVTVKADGTYGYTPTPGFSGTDTFTYAVTDPYGQSATAAVTVTVLPVAEPDSTTVVGGGTLDAAVPAAAGTGPFTAAVTTDPAHGTLALTPDGTFTYTPTPGYVGADSFTYTETDAATGVSKPATVTISVTQPAAPTGVADVGRVAAGGTLDGTSVLANDSGTGTLTAAKASNPADGTVTVAANGTYVYTPASGFSGTDSFTYQVSDAYGNVSAPVTVTITVTPTAVDDTAKVVAGGTLAASSVLANDLGDGLTATLVTGTTHGTLALAADGSYSYTPAPGYLGTDTFTYTATDANGNTSGPATVTITVTQPAAPIGVGDTGTVLAGGTLDGTSVLANDTGTGALTAVPDTSPADGTLSLATDGTYTYTPDPGFSGTDSFTYLAEDAYGGSSAPVTVTITVVPVAVDDTNTVVAGSTLAGTSVLANDLGDGLTATLASGVRGGVLTLAADGTFSYTPSRGFVGSDSFTYTVTDAAGSTSAPATVTIAVTQPAAPTGAPDTGVTTAGTPLDGTSVLDNDAGTGTLTAVADIAPADGTLTLATDGTYVYTPAAGFSGTDSFTYLVHDGYGGVSAPVTVSLTIDPSAAADSATVAGGGTLHGTSVLANDDGTDLTAALVTGPAHGTLTLNPDGTYTYVPTAGYLGADSFTYQAVDSSGHASMPVTVSIGVGQPAAPVGTDDTGAIAAGSVLHGSSVLDNDSGTGALTAVVASAPAHGGVTLATDGTYVYAPAKGFSGTDSFTYDITDAYGNTSAPVTVTITVTPTAAADSATVAGGATLAGTSVLANDQGTGLTAVLVTGPSDGTLTLNADGTYTYTANPGFVGDDSFTYEDVDAGGNLSNPVAVSIGVGQPAAPVGTNDTGTVAAGSTLDGSSVLANDSGAGSLTAVLATAPADGTLTLQPNGAYMYTPAAGFSGTDAFTYTIHDLYDDVSAPVTVTVTVDPTAVADTATVPADGTLTGTSVLANDLGTDLSAQLVTGPAHGTLTLSPDGTYTYVPTPGYKGPDSFTYQAIDAASNTSAPVTVSIGVGQPAAPVGTNDTGTVAAGSTLDGSSVLTNDSGTGSLTAAKASNPAHGTVTVAPDGTYLYTPAAGFSGADTFTYVVDDSFGGTSAPVTVTVTVTPTAVADTATVPADGTLTGASVLANDLGTGLSAQLVTGPAHGTLTLNADGTYTYVPTPGYKGPDSFTYQATDAAGNSSSPVIVSIGVGQPPAPAGTPDTGTTSAGTVLHGGSVLSNDTGTGTLTATKASNPAHGTVTVAPDGTYLYTPAAGFSGTDSFTYVVTDTFGGTSAPVTVTITVDPTAVAGAGAVVKDGTLHGTSVLAGDQGQGLTAVLVTGPAHGTLTLAANGTYIYTPANGYVGADSFTYETRDAAGDLSAPATVHLTVTAVAVAPPVLGGASQTIAVGATPAPITVTTTDGPATVTTSDPAALPPGVRLLPTGAFAGTATTPGTYRFPVTATDAAGRTTTVEATIVVSPPGTSTGTTGTGSAPTTSTSASPLPFTGGPWLDLVTWGLVLTAGGALLFGAARRRHVRTR